MTIESIKEKYFNPEEWIKEKIFQEQGKEQANSNFDYALIVGLTRLRKNI